MATPRYPSPLQAPMGALFRVVSGGMAALLALSCGIVAPAQAQSVSTLTSSADQTLRFGTIVTGGSGSRTVSASGAITDSGVFPVGVQSAGPAQFTLTYYRAPGDLRFLLLTFQITLMSVPKVSVNGVQGSLTGFTSDIPGAPTIQPGQTVNYILPLCLQTLCTVTFHIGATLNIVQPNTGANLTFALPVVTTVTSAFG